MTVYPPAEVITAIRCGECGVWFGLTEWYYSKVQENGRDFYCPNGHAVSYRDTEVKRLRRQVDAERARAARLAAERDQSEASLRATRGVVTKMKRRASAGVCPCCNRTFQQLARHMKSQHPDFDTEPTDAV